MKKNDRDDKQIYQNILHNDHNINKVRKKTFELYEYDFIINGYLLKKVYPMIIIYFLGCKISLVHSVKVWVS